MRPSRWMWVVAACALASFGLSPGCGGRKPIEVALNPDAAVDEVAFASALQAAGSSLAVGAPVEAWVPLLQRTYGGSTVFVAVPLVTTSGGVSAAQAQAVRVDDGRVEVLSYLGEAHVLGLLGGRFETEYPRPIGKPQGEVGAWASANFAAWGAAAAAGDVAGSAQAIRDLARVLPLDAWAATGPAPGWLRRLAAGQLVIGHDHDPSRATPTTVLVLGEERRVLPIVEVAPERWVLGSL